MTVAASLLINPLATYEQLSVSASNQDGVTVALEDATRYETSKFVQALAILLRMPQELAAQAIVLICRFWTGQNGASMLSYDAKDVAAAALYLAVKPSGHSIYPRLLLAVTDFLSQHSPDYSKVLDMSSTWVFSEGKYETAREKLYTIEAKILRTLGFQTHVALPHPLCINYLQALDVFNTPEGKLVSKRAIELLNTALFSSQLLYLTYQPNVLAVSAIYLAARQVSVKLPETEWWEVFDVDREDLGFVVVAMQSVKQAVQSSQEEVAGNSLLTLNAIRHAIESTRGDKAT